MGRLVIYSDVLTSSMDVINTRLEHGLTVIPRRQIDGRGIIFHFESICRNNIMFAIFPARYSNKWLGPKGCVMFTLQVHISITSGIGRYISILQHVVAVALVSAVRSIKGYEVFFYTTN